MMFARVAVIRFSACEGVKNFLPNYGQKWINQLSSPDEAPARGREREEEGKPLIEFSYGKFGGK